MPRNDRSNLDSHRSPEPSEDASTQETLFLLSISRDEDDAAALRADLKRSTLRHYKLQHCANIDDAHHLLQVCGFDLVFIRLDDFQNRQAAIDLVLNSDKDLSLIALASGRLIASDSFIMPYGIDATCRIEDLSPSLIASLVTSVIERKRGEKDRDRLALELEFAIDSGDLGYWSLDIETGRLELSPSAREKLGFAESSPRPDYLDDLVEKCHPDDQDRLKRTIELSIETGDDLRAQFRLARPSSADRVLEVRAKRRPGGPRCNAKLFGFVKREAHASEDIQKSIQAANLAIQKALALRDEAILAAGNELELLLQKLEVIERAEKLSSSSQNSTTLVAAEPAPPVYPVLSPAPALGPLAPSPSAASHLTVDPEKIPDSPDPAALSLDKQSAFQNVLKSIARQKKNQDENTFPFDFSTETRADYSEPNPHAEGFVGAAKRLVNITQIGHKLRVSLSVDNDGAIECERESDLLFEILRELLTNVVKHARASECIIAIFRDEDDWVLQVEDDGVGLENNLVSISTPLNQIGLFRIRTKLALKGGQLDLTPTHPKGLIARARLPVNLTSRGAERA